MYSGSSYTAANLRAKVNDLTHPDKPTDATDFISRYWDIDATGIGGYSNTMTGTYIPADLTGTGSLVKGAVHDGTEWSYAGAAAGSNTVTGSTDDAMADFSGTNFFGKADLIAYLQGPYSSGSMTTLLENAPNLIPLNSPYADAPASVASIPADVVDWVKIELREVGNPSNVLGKASVFIKDNGTIVGLDGTSLPQVKNGNPTSIVALFHRNHLAIRTPNTGLDVVNPILHNFSTGLSQAYDNPALSNDAMIDMGGGVFGLWRGNVNGDLNLNALDFGLTKNNTNPSQSGVYSPYDVNLDRNKNALDLGLVKAITNPAKSAHL
jgi:hypothetical protein